MLTVPYRWDKCDGCHHAHDDISLAQIAAWAGRKPFAYDVVEESDGDERIIVVFRSWRARYRTRATVETRFALTLRD